MGGGVAQHVRPGQPPERDAGAFEVALNDLGDRRGPGKGLHRVGEREEHPPALVGWAAVSKILGQRVSNLLRQRQDPIPAALPSAQAQLPRPPVQVFKLEGNDLAATQAEARQQQEARPVTVLNHGKDSCGILAHRRLMGRV